MKRLLVALILIPFGLMAQVPEAGELFQIRTVTMAEMNAVSNPIEGSLIYNSNQKAIFYYDGNRWINTKKSSHSGTILIPQDPVNNLNNPNLTRPPLDIVVNDVPFKPSRIEFVAYANVDVLNLNDDNSTGQNNNGTKENSFGYMTGYAQLNADGTIAQQVISGGGSGNSINDISRYASSSFCVGIRYGNQNGDQVGLTTAELVSFDDNGFTIRSRRRDDALVVIYTAFQ